MAIWILLLSTFHPAIGLAQSIDDGALDDDQISLIEARDVIDRYAKRENLTPEDVTNLIDFSENLKESLKDHLPLGERIARTFKNPWVMFGFFAQCSFMMRFVIQIIASERRKRSYVPVSFWYLSLFGGLMLLVYAIQRRDPVFVFGQGLGCFIYVRNLYLIHRRQSSVEQRANDRGAPSTATEGEAI